jgi:hypothetical protein
MGRSQLGGSGEFTKEMELKTPPNITKKSAAFCGEGKLFDSVAEFTKSKRNSRTEASNVISEVRKMKKCQELDQQRPARKNGRPSKKDAKKNETITRQIDELGGADDSWKLKRRDQEDLERDRELFVRQTQNIMRRKLLICMDVVPLDTLQKLSNDGELKVYYQPVKECLAWKKRRCQRKMLQGLWLSTLNRTRDTQRTRARVTRWIILQRPREIIKNDRRLSRLDCLPANLCWIPMTDNDETQQLLPQGQRCTYTPYKNPGDRDEDDEIDVGADGQEIEELDNGLFAE